MQQFMNKVGFNEEEQIFANRLLDGFDETIFDHFRKLKDIFFMTDTTMEQIQCRDYVENELKSLSKKAACHEFSMYLGFLLCCYEDLKRLYEKENIDPSFFYNIACDITCKVRECKSIHGMIGVKSFAWFHNHFLMKLFALGRFQYVKGEFNAENSYEFENITINPGDDVYYIHIPSGASMTEENRYWIRSYSI